MWCLSILQTQYIVFSSVKMERGQDFGELKINKNLHKSYNLAQKTDIKMQQHKK